MHLSTRDIVRKYLTLIDFQQKKYPFSNFDLSRMLDDLLKKGIIELPPLKSPEEVGKTNDP